MARHLSTHGDAVKDVAFEVDDAERVYYEAVKNGAVGVSAPKRLEDSNGSAIVATVRTYGDTTHTLVQRSGYRGPFLPGFKVAAKGTGTVVLPDVRTKVTAPFEMTWEAKQREPVSSPR